MDAYYQSCCDYYEALASQIISEGYTSKDYHEIARGHPDLNKDEVDCIVTIMMAREDYEQLAYEEECP